MSISSVSGQGTSSLQDLLATMQSGSQSSSGVSEDASSLQAKLMEEFDTDGNGELSEEELAALVEKLEAMQDNLAMMNQMRMGEGEDDGGLIGSLMQSLEESGETEAADADGDGEVTPEEALAYFGLDQEGDALLSAVQNAGTGSSGSEEEEEEETSVTEAAAAGSSSSTEEADLNGDGVVTQEEWAEFYGVSAEDLQAMGLGGSQGSESGNSMAKLLREAVQAYRDAYNSQNESSLDSLGGLMDLGSGVDSVA